MIQSYLVARKGLGGKEKDRHVLYSRRLMLILEIPYIYRRLGSNFFRNYRLSNCLTNTTHLHPMPWLGFFRKDIASSAETGEREREYISP